MKLISVLVIDDSALMRKLLTDIINADPGMEVVGVAEDPYVARDQIKLLNPDVLTLDIEMPKMNGITFLRNLMRLRPMPVVMVSTLTEKGASATLESMELGALDYVAKSTLQEDRGIAKFSKSLFPAITSKVSGGCSTPSTTIVVLNKTGIEDSLASRVTSIPPRSHSCLAVT